MALRKNYTIYRVLATKLKNSGITIANNKKDLTKIVKARYSKGSYIAIPNKRFLKVRDIIVIKK